MANKTLLTGCILLCVYLHALHTEQPSPPGCPSTWIGLHLPGCLAAAGTNPVRLAKAEHGDEDSKAPASCYRKGETQGNWYPGLEDVAARRVGEG